MKRGCNFERKVTNKSIITLNNILGKTTDVNIIDLEVFNFFLNQHIS